MTQFTVARAAQLVATFDLSGIHRAGAPGDFASGDWLAAEAHAAGAAVARMPVTVNRTVSRGSISNAAVSASTACRCSIRRRLRLPALRIIWPPMARARKSAISSCRRTRRRSKACGSSSSGANPPPALVVATRVT